ncbi:hypothetical protein ENUP19_0041G0128 [Entamoeba nuttalli]|uniref:TLDc domain-containing protein n=2 Tax=Entamoeba nuttalli TaxID=412467 RepID=K2GFY3_ENTNP|nr:hypothetical protein ENU1_050330 [Entamoeba nuttalli P19]EKE41606.1 hypothetical protein ENU1_050330 [Entamoeba nuttalli P19]|eukprot:XP_008856061.1 hypothetical protein ENU1_050330 [Entamoeba nuttalli P19]
MTSVNIINNYGIINFTTPSNDITFSSTTGTPVVEPHYKIINLKTNEHETLQKLDFNQPKVVNSNSTTPKPNIIERSVENSFSPRDITTELTHLYTQDSSHKLSYPQNFTKSCKHPSLNLSKRKESEHSPEETIKHLSTNRLSHYSKLTHGGISEEFWKLFLDNEGLGLCDEIMKQWTGFKEMKLIYDSSQQFFDSRGFNEKVCGRKNLLIIVVSGKSIFGSWHSKQIPKEKKDGFVYVKNDENHFVFTLRNIYNINPTKFLPREVNHHSKSLCISGSKNSTCIVGCYSCYFVETLDNESTVDWSFSSTYRDTSGKGHLIFTGKQAFTTDRLLAFYGE